MITPLAPREAISLTLRAHPIECAGRGEVTCLCRTHGWMSRTAYHDHLTDELLMALRDAAPVGDRRQDLEGAVVSVDVSTGDHDAFRRIFARVSGTQYDPQTGGTMLLAEETGDNNDRQESS